MPIINTQIPDAGFYNIEELYQQSRLDMINRCLRAIGETPLPAGTLVSTISLGTDVDIAARTVDETIREVLTIGWYFNIDYNYKLYKDEGSFIYLPKTVLRMDTQESNQYIVKNSKVYDIYNQTFIIEPDYIEADLIYNILVEDLPVEAYEYISLRAARKFQEIVITSSDLVQTTRTAEMEAYTRLQRRQLQTQAYNIQNARVSTRIHNGYLQRGLYGTKYRR